MNADLSYFWDDQSQEPLLPERDKKKPVRKKRARDPRNEKPRGSYPGMHRRRNKRF